MCFISHARQKLVPCVCREAGKHCARMTCPKLSVITSVTWVLFTAVSSVQLTPFGGRCWVRVEETPGETGKAHSLLLLWAMLCDIPSASTGEQLSGGHSAVCLVGFERSGGTSDWWHPLFPEGSHTSFSTSTCCVWQAAHLGVQAWLWVMVISLLSPAGSSPSPSDFFLFFLPSFTPSQVGERGSSPWGCLVGLLLVRRFVFARFAALKSFTSQVYFFSGSKLTGLPTPL